MDLCEAEGHCWQRLDLMSIQHVGHSFERGVESLQQRIKCIRIAGPYSYLRHIEYPSHVERTPYTMRRSTRKYQHVICRDATGTQFTGITGLIEDFHSALDQGTYLVIANIGVEHSAVTMLHLINIMDIAAHR